MKRFALLLLLGSAFGIEAQTPPPNPPASKDEAKVAIEAKRKETKDLAARATAVTNEIGDLAKSGKLPQDEAAIEQMKKLVEELSEIRKRLATIESELARMDRALDGLDESVPKIRRDLDDLLRHREGNYIQFQYRATDQRNNDNDSFRMRRIRLGITDRVDSKTSFRVSFDLAANPNLIGPTGSSVATSNSDVNAQLRDAYLDYLAIAPTGRPGLLIRGGQQFLPLGYDIERSSSDREFPERAVYNTSLFPGERSRGIQVRFGPLNNVSLGLGVFTPLSVNDPEQRTNQGSPGSRLAVTGSVRYTTPKASVGVTALVGERASQVVGYDPVNGQVKSPEVDRQLIYIDGEVPNMFGTKLSLRGEAMTGRDRLGIQTVTTSSGSNAVGITDPDSRRLQERPLAGWHLQLSHPINQRNRLAVRYEQFDPDLDRSGDLLFGYGAAWIHQLNPNARITFAHEIFEDAARHSLGQTRFGVTTIRVQYKF